MTSKQKVARALVTVACVALHLTAVQTIGAQRTSKTTKKPTPPPTTVTPTASEGSTAMAIRGRPANPAATKAVAAALKTALAKPAVKNAVRAEVLRQLRSQRPIAVVSGAWVTLVDLGQIYSVPAIRMELLASLGANGPQLLGPAGGGANGLTVAFTKISLGKLLMPDMVGGVESTIGVDALKNHMTEGLLGDLVGGVFGVTDAMIDATQFVLKVAETMLEAGEQAADGNGSYYPNADIDSDGVPNWKDDDDDGDGVTDQNDAYPADKSKSICDCGRPRVMAFGSSVAANLLPTLISGASAAARASRVTLGPMTTGQSGTLEIVF